MAHNKLTTAARALVLALAVAPAAHAMQNSQPSQGARPGAPATVASPAESMRVVVAEVKGIVNVSLDGGHVWKPATVDMIVGEGAIFRTGLRSSVTCVIPPDQQFTLESLGTVRVNEAIRKGSRIKTDLIMKYGATRYSIEAAGVEHDSTIRTPGSTLAVRGTQVRVTDRPGFAPTAESYTGRALFRSANRVTAVGAKGGKYAKVSSSDGSAAQTSLAESVVDPSVAAAHTVSDERLIQQEVSRGAVLSFDTRADIPVIRGGAGPLTDAQIATDLPGKLTLFLRWTGKADLNFVVDDEPVTPQLIQVGQRFIATHPGHPEYAGLPLAAVGQLGITQSQPPPGFRPQEFLYPGFGQNVTSTGGVIPYDNRGGKNGGMEIAYWTNPPAGVYGVGALQAAGAPTDLKINAFYDGKPLNLYSVDSNFNLYKTHTYTSGSRDNPAAILYVPAFTPLENDPTIPSADTTPAAKHPVRSDVASSSLKPAASRGFSGPALATPVAGPAPSATFGRR